MSDSLWTFVFEIANFAALAAVLAWLFFKPVRKAIADQSAKAKRQEEEASAKLAAAEGLRQDIASQREALAAELEATRSKSREIAKQEAEQIVAEGRAHVERERATLRRDRLHIERTQAAKIADAVAVATHGTMKRFLEQMEGPELEQILIQAACRELKTLSSKSLDPVTIESATAFDKEARQLLNASLGDAAKTANYRVDPELKGGLRIATANGLIDASVAGLADFAAQSLSAEIKSMLREESENE